MDARVETPVTEKAKISVRDLNFYYGGFHALKHINLDLPEKKVTAFIGPSGCGKSTLLRTFNRMFELYPEQRAEGQILVDGEDILNSKLDVSLIRSVGPVALATGLGQIAFTSLVGFLIAWAWATQRCRRSTSPCASPSPARSSS